MRRASLLFLILFLVAATAADACTTFCTRGLFGRNYDWDIGYGMLTVNKRAMTKSSSARTPKPARWTSKYGSLTFNQYGRDNPTGGMNERGLVVEVMWLEPTVYPTPDARPEVSTLEWVQYQLDTAATVAEVLASLNRVRIGNDNVPLHFLIADRTGDVAALEFLGGNPIIRRGAKLPHAVLANDPYDSSLAGLRRGANDRFARAAKGLAGATTIDSAFSLLADVADPRRTQWSIVYDQRNLVVHYRTRANRQTRRVRMNALDYACSTPVTTLDIDRGRDDVTTSFRNYTRAENLALVRKSVRETPFLRLSDAEIDEAARWPERAACGHL